MEHTEPKEEATAPKEAYCYPTIMHSMRHNSTGYGRLSTDRWLSLGELARSARQTGTFTASRAVGGGWV